MNNKPSASGNSRWRNCNFLSSPVLFCIAFSATEISALGIRSRFNEMTKKLRFATLAVLTFGEISHLLLRQLNASRFLNLLSFDVRECSPRTWMLAVRKNVDIRLSISRSRSVRLALKVWPRFKVHLSPVTNSVLARSKCFYSFTFSSFVASIKSFFSVPRYLV